MPYNFTEDDKAATDEFQERIPFGVSEVTLVGATSGDTQDDKNYIELTVADKSGLEDSARVWFTGKASPYSFQTLRQIVVHTAKTEADKEKARQAVENCKNSDELADLLNTKCTGKQFWFTKYYDPTRTYTNQKGDLKRSINTSVYGYEPKLKPELMPTQSDMQTEIIPDNVGQIFPGATPADGAAAADGIPSKWDN